MSVNGISSVIIGLDCTSSLKIVIKKSFRILYAVRVLPSRSRPAVNSHSTPCPTNWPVNGTVDVERERHGSKHPLPVVIDWHPRLRRKGSPRLQLVRDRLASETTEERQAGQATADECSRDNALPSPVITYH